MNTSVAPGSVVVGVDGSEGSDRAVRWAAALAHLQRRPLALVHGTGAPVANDFGFDLVESRRALRQQGRRATEHALGIVRREQPDVDVVEHVTIEDPRSALAAAGRQASLLVVGSRGRGAVASLLLGSVSVAVTSHAPCPVAVVRGEDADPPAHLPVVLGLDVRAPAGEAARAAYELASWTARPLLVIHAVGDLRALPYLDLLGPEELEEIREEAERHVAESLAGLAEKFPDVVGRVELVHASPAEALRAASGHAALVVVGARDRGGLARLALGSVSRSVVEHARCTAVVVPQNGGSS